MVKAAFTWDPIWKMTNMKFQTGLSFVSLYIKSHIGTTGKLLYVIPCKIMFILETNMAEKRSMEKESLLTGTLKVH